MQVIIPQNQELANYRDIDMITHIDDYVYVCIEQAHKFIIAHMAGIPSFLIHLQHCALFSLFHGHHFVL